MYITLGIGREGRQKPVHVRLAQWARSLNKKVRQERRWVETVVPVNGTRIVSIELDLHDN